MKAAPAATVNRNVPGVPIPGGYGEAGSRLSTDGGMTSHQVQAQTGQDSPPGTKDGDFGVAAIDRPVGGRTPRRERVAADSERGAAAPVRGSAGYRSTAAADHGSE